MEEYIKKIKLSDKDEKDFHIRSSLKTVKYYNKSTCITFM